MEGTPNAATAKWQLTTIADFGTVYCYTFYFPLCLNMYFTHEQQDIYEIDLKANSHK